MEAAGFEKQGSVYVPELQVYKNRAFESKQDSDSAAVPDNPFVTTNVSCEANGSSGSEATYRYLKLPPDYSALLPHGHTKIMIREEYENLYAEIERLLCHRKSVEVAYEGCSRAALCRSSGHR